MNPYILDPIKLIIKGKRRYTEHIPGGGEHPNSKEEESSGT